MGADLITVMVVGPDRIKLTKAQRQAALSKARARIKACKKWEGGKLPDGLWDELDVEKVAEMDPNLALREVLELWSGKISLRDTNSRTATIGGETCRIVVAGCTSWGDSPEGGGYQILMDAEKLGILDSLGLK